jgi:DNA-binding response OmpR family regulator
MSGVQMKYPTSALIIEESKTFSMYLTLLLRNMGIKALRISEPEMAKTILGKGFTDILIIGDHSKPVPTHTIVKDLFEAVIDDSIPIIVISSCAKPDERKACIKAGCHDYLLKPVQPRELHDALYSRVTPESERRESLRCKVSLTAEVSIVNQQMQSHKVLTLSKGGALLSSTLTLSTGTEVKLLLCLDNVQISITGYVIYNLARVKDGNEQAFGVIFRQIDPSYADMIDQYVQKSLNQFQHLNIDSKQKAS